MICFLFFISVLVRGMLKNVKNISDDVIKLTSACSVEELGVHSWRNKLMEGCVFLLYTSCLENPRDRGAWWPAIYGVAQSRTRLKQLSSSSITSYTNLYQHFLDCDLCQVIMKNFFSSEYCMKATKLEKANPGCDSFNLSTSFMCYFCSYSLCFPIGMLLKCS